MEDSAKKKQTKDPRSAPPDQPKATWKERGNEFFKMKDYLKAINCWEEALQQAKDRERDLQAQAQSDTDRKTPQNPEEVELIQKKLKEIITTKAQLSGNLALGHLKRGEIDEAEFYNLSCLHYDPNNVKAHYRVVQIHIARNELKEAQDYAVQCTSRFRSQGENQTKPFKDILLGEIAGKIRNRMGKDAVRDELLKAEQSLIQLIQEQATLQRSQVDEYISLLNYYKNEKVENFPSTLTSVLFQNFMIHGQYDQQATLEILQKTRYNLPFKNLLLIDVVKPHVVAGLLEEGNKDEIVSKNKYQRMPLICSLLSNLFKITDPHILGVIISHFLIRDYDHGQSSNQLNMVTVLNHMINNCYIDAARTEDTEAALSIDYYNLTNDIYVSLIEELLRSYITNFEEAFSDEINPAFAIQNVDANQEESQIVSLVEQSQSSGTDGGPQLSHLQDKHLQIENLLICLFKMYNQDQFNNDETEELQWLFNVVDHRIGKSSSEEAEAQEGAEFCGMMKIVALNILFKVYYDHGYQRLIGQNIMGKLILESKSEKFGALRQYQSWSILNTLAQSKKGREWIRAREDPPIFTGRVIDGFITNAPVSAHGLELTLLAYATLSKAMSDVCISKNEWAPMPPERVQAASARLLDMGVSFSEVLQQQSESNNHQVQRVTALMFDCMGYMALKEGFKQVFLEKALIDSDGLPGEGGGTAKAEKISSKVEEAAEEGKALVSGIKYMILESLHQNMCDNSKRLHNKVTAQLGIISLLTFFLMNMARSEDYDTMVPSLTLKVHDQLKNKEVSYYELKQLSKAMQNSRQLLGQLTQKFMNEYGSEELAQKIRYVLVSDLQILSLFNGQFAMSKQGPRSALSPNALRKQDVDPANVDSLKLSHNLSRNKFASVYLKQMISEILVLVACNNLQSAKSATNLQQSLALVPQLVINNMIGFLVDLRSSIFEDTSKDHEIAIEAEINIAQTLAKIFISTNPLLIHDNHKHDSIKIMAKRLLAPETHHELLVYEGLLALTNISTCLQQGPESASFAKDLINLPCGLIPKTEESKEGEASKSTRQTVTLYHYLTKELLFEKNVQIKLATCELLSNLSLSPSLEQMAEDCEMKTEASFPVDCQNLICILKQVIDNTGEEYGQHVIDSFCRAILGFFANLICHEGVRTFIKEVNGGLFINSILPSILIRILGNCQQDTENGMSRYLDIVHRLIFIADEYLREEDLNIFDPLDSDIKGKVLDCLQLFAQQNDPKVQNAELKSLCAQFLEIFGREF